MRESKVYFDDRKKEKKNYICSIIKDSEELDLLSNEKLSEKKRNEISKIIFNNFCKVTSPYTLPPPSEHGPKYDTHFTLSGEVFSVQPGHIILNWKKLLVDGSESILIMAGAMAINPLLIPLASLVLLNKLQYLQNIKLSDKHAAIIMTIWKNMGKNDFINPSNLLDMINAYLKNNNRPTMTIEEMNNVLVDLEKMNCIGKTDNNSYWLKEQVELPYYS